MSKYFEAPIHKTQRMKQLAKDIFEKDIKGASGTWGCYNPFIVIENENEVGNKEKNKRVIDEYVYNSEVMYLGREFKSFYEVTDALGWKRTKSGSMPRQRQERVIAQYCRLERVPNTKSKYIINEVYETIIPKRDYRLNENLELLSYGIQKQIMLILANKFIERKEEANGEDLYWNQSFLFSKGTLIEYVGLVNHNFKNIRYNIKKYSKENNINEKHTLDMINSINTNANNCIKKALNKLDGKYLTYREGISISFDKPIDEITGEIGYIQDEFATDNQISFIKVLCERTVLNHYGLNSVKDIFSPLKNKNKISLGQFYKEVVELARKLSIAENSKGSRIFEYDIQILENMDYYYSSYKITTFSPILEEFENQKLTQDEKMAIASLFDFDEYSRFLMTLGTTKDVNNNSLDYAIQLANDRCAKNNDGKYSYRQSMNDDVIKKIASDAICANYKKTNEDRLIENMVK